MVLQCISGVSSNPVKGRTKICQLKNLILTLFGLIFRRCDYVASRLKSSLRSTVVITNWLIFTKYPFLKWQWIFCLLCRFGLTYITDKALTRPE